jgi:hypothetical protein
LPVVFAKTGGIDSLFVTIFCTTKASRHRAGTT